MVYTATVNYIKDPTLFRGGKIECAAQPAGLAQAQVDPESPVYARARRDFSQKEYMYPAAPLFLGCVDLAPPAEPLYALRLLLKQPGSEYVLPERLLFMKDFLLSCAAYQMKFFPAYEERFVYVTVRSGEVVTSRDDEFHTDGFQGISVPRHIPEQNYLWADSYPTLFSLQPYFVEDLDPGQHNFHSYFDRHTDRNHLYKGVDKGLYIIDPYHVHARQKLPRGTYRTVLRLTFSPVEIRDNSNTTNIWLPRGPYNRDDIRNRLAHFDGPAQEGKRGLQKL